MRQRAVELATQCLCPRTTLEIQRSRLREIGQERLTQLDRTLQKLARADRVDLIERLGTELYPPILRARLQRLETMGLAKRLGPNQWHLSPRLDLTLTALGERGDILRTMHKALRGQTREHVLAPPPPSAPVIGRVAAKGVAGGQVVQTLVRTHGVVVLAPGFDNDAGFPTTAKPLQTETLVAQLAVERFVGSILPGLAGIDHRGVDAIVGKPL